MRTPLLVSTSLLIVLWWQVMCLSAGSLDLVAAALQVGLLFFVMRLPAPAWAESATEPRRALR